ncbi:YqjF family protein [Parasphingorhabdus pacifica]
MRSASRPDPEPVTVEPPSQAWLAPIRMAFTDVTFMHWSADREQIASLLPPGTEPDTYAGRTYVGLVAFRMRSYGPFLETNVRVFSVDHKGRRGIVFLGIESDRLPWILAARAGWLPCAWSRMSLVRDAYVLTYDSARRWPGRPTPRSRIQVRVGPPTDGSPLEHFLTARWRLHLRVPGRTLTTQLSHDRWPLHNAELLELDDQLITAAGLPAPTTAPSSVLYAPVAYGRLGLPQCL